MAHGIMRLFRNAFRREPTLELEDVDDHSLSSGHLDLVDEAALSIISHNRVRAARVKTVVWILVFSGAIVLAVGLGVAYSRKLQSDETNLMYTLGSSASYKSHVDELCGSENIQSAKGRLSCMEACADSSCCRAKEQEENCIKKFASVCLEYQACSILEVYNNMIESPSSTTYVPPAPFNLESLCEFHTLSTNTQLEDCFSACSSAVCCFPSAGANNCYDYNFENCAGYRMCYNVFQETVGPSIDPKRTSTPSSGTPGNALDTLSRACQAEILAFPGERRACHELCESFLCCFEPSPVTGETCSSKSECSRQEISPCKLVFEYASRDENMTELSEYGSPNSILNVANKTEDQILSPTKEGLQSEIIRDQDIDGNIIVNYTMVANESHNKSSEHDNVTTNYPGDRDFFMNNSSDMWASQVAVSCQNQIVAHVSKRRACQDLCEPVLCCFAHSPLGRCDANPKCSHKSVKPCKILLEYGTMDDNMILQDNYGQSDISNTTNETDAAVLSAEIYSFSNASSFVFLGGVVSVHLSKNIRIKMHVIGLESHCMPSNTGGCGIHIHEGKTCDSKDQVMGHYWNKLLLGERDPWLNMTYETNGKGESEVVVLLLGGNGYSIDENIGHAMVIHEQNGDKIACGILTQTQESLPDSGRDFDPGNNSDSYLDANNISKIDIAQNIGISRVTDDFEHFR